MEDRITLENLITLISTEAALVYSVIYAAIQEIFPSPEIFFGINNLKIITKLMESKSLPYLQAII